MFLRERIFRNGAGYYFLRFRRIWIFVLAVFMLQDVPQESVGQSLNSAGALRSLQTSIAADDHLSPSWTHAQTKETQNRHARLVRALHAKNGETHSTFNAKDGNESFSHTSTESVAPNKGQLKNAKPLLGTVNVTHSLDALPFSRGNVTNNVNNAMNANQSTNSSKDNQRTHQSLPNVTKHLSSTVTKSKAKATGYTIQHSTPLSDKIHLESKRNITNDKTKQNFKSRKKKREHPPFLSKTHRRRHRHRHHYYRRSTRSHKSVKPETWNKNKWSLGIGPWYGRQSPLRDAGERVLLRFKRKSLAGDNAQKGNLHKRKKTTKRKRQQGLYERERPRDVSRYRTSKPVNVFSNSGYSRGLKQRLNVATAPFTQRTSANNQPISQIGYKQQVRFGKGSTPPLNSIAMRSNHVGTTFNIYQIPRNFPGFVPNSPMRSTSNVANSRDPFEQETLPAEISSRFLPDPRTRKQARNRNTRPQNLALTSKKPYTQLQQPITMQYPRGQIQWRMKPAYTALRSKQLISSNYKTERNFYGSARASVYPRPLTKPQITDLDPQTERKYSQFLLPSNSNLNRWKPALLSADSHVTIEGDQSRVSEGLIVYLNFEGARNGDATVAAPSANIADSGKRTEVTKSTGSCGNAARLGNGSEILLNGGQIKVKPRQAISIAAWIRLDNNRGFHSIFDTVGGHSLHQDGQYHFEVQDGRARWFHRNETANQIFSVETDPIIPADAWTHLVGTYDSRSGWAKLFVDGRLRAEAHGTGLLSQDWDAHAGLGKHKGQRFLQGEVDEFRIYNKALSQEDIQDLMKVCSFAKVCGGMFNSPSGIIESPNWPNHYRGKALCTWTVSVDPSEVVTLRFNNFSLEQDRRCDKARLVVRDGSKDDNRELGFYCGMDSPIALTSSGNHLWLQFTSNEWADGKGFRVEYYTQLAQKTKKQETPITPKDDSNTCAVTRPEFNVTLVGGIKSGIFSEARLVHDMDLCTRHCCLKKSCDLAFMIRETCYLVDCFNEELCTSKKARRSTMNPRISYVSHLQAQSREPELSSAGNAYDKPVALPTTLPTTLPTHTPPPRCRHTAVSYNATLVSGINAGKFSTYGSTSTIEECARHCCRDNKCDLAFMIQGNCYTVECADAEGCQVKKAKSSNYNPTVAYVYRGNGKPIGEPLIGAEKPSPDACSKLTVGDTIYNVTLRGGMKAGNFTDKGVVTSMSECSAFCCKDNSCNVAFLIRDNCFLVACRDYDSCQVKPALSEYYHPRLAYVSWNPPDDEVPANRWYASLGCWKDTDVAAVASLEGSDSLLADSYTMRERPIDKCARVARKHSYKVFAIQNGGACLGGPTAGRMFNQYGESSSCRAGKGGVFANDVYRLTDSGSYISLGCWNDSQGHALPFIQHNDPKSNLFPKSHTDPLRKCGELARARSYTVFALRSGGVCLGGPRAEIDYKKYGISRSCRDGFGGPYANSVYRLIDNLGLEIVPTESTQNFSSPTPGSSTASTTTDAVSTTNGMSDDLTATTQTGTPRTPTTSPSPTPQIQENYITLQDGQPRKNSYTASEIKYNVTLKYGIKTGRFKDKGKVGNMSECIRACGRVKTCSLAFMLGKQCFAVSCYSDALCQTKPAFSQFYRPKIAFVKHENVILSENASQPSHDSGQCRTSDVHNDVTLVGGINAGKFADFGEVASMDVCIKRCCLKDTCDLAFLLESECYGVTCVNETLCETRPARNPERYNPKIVYVYHDKKKDKALKRPKLRNVLNLIERLLYGKKPPQHSGTIFRPIDEKYVDTTDFSVDSDPSKDANNDVSSMSRKLVNAKQLNGKKTDAQFPTDIFTPTTPQAHNGRVAGDLNGEEDVSVNARPKFYNGAYSNKVPSKLISTASPSFPPTNPSMTANQGMTGFGILNLDSAQSNFRTPLKQVTTAIQHKLRQTNNADQLNHVTPTQPLTGFSLEKPNPTTDRTWRVLLRAWIKQRLSMLALRRSGTELKSSASYNNNNNKNALGLMTDLATLKAIFSKLPSRFKQNFIASRNAFTNSSPLQQEITQTLNSLFEFSPIATERDKNVCWDGEILYNHTLVGGINAGTFTDNGKTDNMDICMQFCCKQQSCDLAFMIEDDCYSVACSSADECEPRKARPTHYFPRVALRKKTQGNPPTRATPEILSSTPATSPTPSTPGTPLTSPSTTGSPTLVTADPVLIPPVHVAHSCAATPIEHNVTLKMGLHSGVFQKIGKVDSIDDCIEMCCRQPQSDVAFMLGSMCYTVHCYSEDLCKTVPIFASSISRLNLNPAISFLRMKSRFRPDNLAAQNDGIPQDTCMESTITYNVTLRGGIGAGNFTERPDTSTMRECISKCCNDLTCDLAFMFGDHCYSVACESEKLCQAVLAKSSQLEPKISYVTRGFVRDEKDKGTIFSASDETPTCRADQKSRSKVVSNRTLVGGLEAGKFNFLGVVRNMDMCMDRCCGRQGCNVAYMVDKNCFSVACYSLPLCQISDVPSANGDVQISTVMESTAEKPAEKHSMVVYVIIGVVGFAAGAGGILWAVCMFLRRHRLRSRHRQDTE